MSELRSKDLWLVDRLATNELPQNLLPLTGEVLRVLGWHAKRNPRDLTKAIRETTLKIQEQWEKANIPTINYCHILKKVKKLHKEYAALKKSKSRESGKAVENRMSFQVKLKPLFDIAHQNAMQLMTIKEDRDFLEAQRKHRREGKMLGLDQHWVSKEERKQIMTVMKRLQQEKEAYEERFAKTKYASSLSSSSSPLDQSPCRSPVKKSCRERKAAIINAEVAAALDQSQVHEFTVEMTCEGCSNAVKRVMDKLEDKVSKVDIDLEAKKVCVSTSLSSDEILEKLKKTGKEVNYIKSSPAN